MWARTLALAAIGAWVGMCLACSPDRTPDVPPNTPVCEETCDAAWPCGGTLENDLAACKSLCEDELHAEFRICVNETECDLMYECKVYAPGDFVPTNNDTGE